MPLQDLIKHLKSELLPAITGNGEAEYFAEKVYEFDQKRSNYPNLVCGENYTAYADIFKFVRTTFGLSFSPTFGELSIYPRAGKLVVLPSWKGYLRLIQRSDLGVRVVTDFVTANERVVDIEAKTPVFEHHKDPFRKESDWEYFYCVIYTQDGHIVERVDKAKFTRLESMAKAGGTIWKAFPIEMGRKSAFLQAKKWLDINPSNPKHAALITALEAESGEIDLGANQQAAEEKDTQKAHKAALAALKAAPLGRAEKLVQMQGEVITCLQANDKGVLTLVKQEALTNKDIADLYSAFL